MRGSERVAALVLSFALALATPVSYAAEPSPADLAAARELFGQGVKLEEAHAWSAALEKFTQVAAVKQTPAVHFHLGLCLQNTGKLASAYLEFKRAEAGAALDPSPDGALIGSKAKKHLGELVGKVPFLTLRIPDGATGLAVTIDGERVTEASHAPNDAEGPSSVAPERRPIAVDPGEHVVRVESTGRVPFERKITLEVGEAKTVDVALPSSSTPTPTPVKETPRPQPVASSGAGPLPWIIGAIGVAAFAGAGTMYAYRGAAIAELEGACSSGHSDCPPSKRSVADHGRTYTLAGNILLVAGGVAIATSVVLFVLPRPKSSTSGSVRVYVGGASPLGGGLMGSF
ncbi:MAG: hypothetical protein ACXVEE_37920 [Polyangiales bacterium]